MNRESRILGIVEERKMEHSSEGAVCPRESCPDSLKMTVFMLKKNNPNGILIKMPTAQLTLSPWATLIIFQIKIYHLNNAFLLYHLFELRGR
jgi:hypothetical protein